MSALTHDYDFPTYQPSHFERFNASLKEVPIREPAGKTRMYKQLCAAMQTVDGLSIVVRKDLWVDSHVSCDWFVARINKRGYYVEDTVLSASITEGDFLDEICLELAPDVAYHGPYELRFEVDELYQHTNTPVVLSHLPYYGRGTDPLNNKYIDAVFTRRVLPLPKTSNVTPITVASSYNRVR